TDVRLFQGERALGTRVSQQVRDHVMGRGETWLGRAFVVNDWYISGYEPIHDSLGERVGMLYVGYLEAPFRRVTYVVLGVTVGLFLLISAAGSWFALSWASSIFRPLERMDHTMSAVEAGDASARVGSVASKDEIGRLAEHFDLLLQNLQQQNEKLRRSADELDLKVAERTHELQLANESLREAQRQLLMSEKLAALGQLTAGVAHEINNPIAVIQGNLDVAREELGDAAKPVLKEIRLIDEQVNRIRIIVTKLLQFARPQEFAGYVEQVDVNDSLDDSLVLVQHTMRLVEIKVARDYRAVRQVGINRTELQQVLINLMVNAVHAMAQGGALTLATRDWDDKGVVVSVKDTGHGIEKKDLSRIFDPFYTTRKQQGTGLGLSISYSLVERYGGHITVQSQVGVGTEFSVWLLSEPVFLEGGSGEDVRFMESVG
ncbi:MAG: sensor histidine kinase, partial [Burkholderiales bacterium]